MFNFLQAYFHFWQHNQHNFGPLNCLLNRNKKKITNLASILNRLCDEKYIVYKNFESIEGLNLERDSQITNIKWRSKDKHLECKTF